MANFKSYCNIKTGSDNILLMGDNTGTPVIADCDGCNTLINSLAPDFIVGIGDWEDDQATTFRNIYTLNNLGGLTKVSVPGNHDFDFIHRTDYNKAFCGGGYKKIRGVNVDFFLYDLYLNDAEDGYYTYINASARNEASFKTTKQGIWLLAEIAASTATWKVVVFHQCCTDWTSGTLVSNLRLDGMKWDWKGYGVDLILNGHEHFYERLLEATGSGNIPIVQVGTTGATQNPVPGVPVAGSQYLSGKSVDADMDAGNICILEASPTSLTVKTYGVKDDLTLSALKDTLLLSK